MLPSLLTQELSQLLVGNDFNDVTDNRPLPRHKSVKISDTSVAYTAPFPDSLQNSERYAPGYQSGRLSEFIRPHGVRAATLEWELLTTEPKPRLIFSQHPTERESNEVP
jgi:hypothetical protein